MHWLHMLRAMLKWQFSDMLAKIKHSEVRKSVVAKYTWHRFISLCKMKSRFSAIHRKLRVNRSVDYTFLDVTCGCKWSSKASYAIYALNLRSVNCILHVFSEICFFGQICSKISWSKEYAFTSSSSIVISKVKVAK